MSKKKGLSVEEKRKRMMEFFYETKDFFQLKELEKRCQKEKGITSMSVKEILQSLVDDDMVDTDKIGTSVYFWAFPSKASQNRKTKIDNLTKKIKEVSEKKRQMKDLIAKASVGKENTEKRSAILAELDAKKELRDKLLAELEGYKECDPEVIEEIKKQTELAKEASNRWTDNVFSIKDWIKKKFAFDESVINKQFDIPEEFDYV